MRLRRNTRLKIYNSIFAGWSRGVRIESEGSYSSAVNDDSLTVQNTIIAGVRGSYFLTDVSAGSNGIRTWFMQSELNNDTLALATELKITDPFNYTAPNFQPLGDSRVLCGSIWSTEECGISGVSEVNSNESFISVYPNPFSESTTLSIHLNNDELVSIMIYNISGKLVKIFDAGYLSTGENSFTLDASAFEKGLYFAKVTIGEKSEMVKLLIK
jgi:hypothetical protein